MKRDKLSDKELEELRKYYDVFYKELDYTSRKERYSLEALDKPEDMWYN